MRPGTSQPQNTMLIDNFDRHVTYLRLSVTDRCDLRCIYCMSENMQFVAREQLLTLEEIVRVGKVFTELGVRKIRLTGGEPLTRRNILHAVRQLGQLPELKELCLTTNGTQLQRYAAELRAAGVNRINISLDSLNDENFTRITRVGKLQQVIAGIDAAVSAGFERIKLNSVVMKHKNHDEVTDLVAFALERNIDISFIEEMPLGVTSNHDRAYAFYSSAEILRDLGRRYSLVQTVETTGGPSRYYRISGSDSRIGFISPHSQNFCANCNRVRLTAEGRLLLCLGQENSVDLREIVRQHPQDDTPLRQAIVDSMAHKPLGHEFNLQQQPVILRHMNVTGG